MTNDRHCVAGFFGDLAPALATQAKLHVLGFSADQLQVFKRDSGAWVPDSQKVPQAGSNAALKDMVVDGAIGGAVGVGLGALAEVALVAANVSLFIASPLLAPLVLLGWGATLGGTIGAMVGAEKKEAPLSALIRDAVASGQFVLVVEARTQPQAAIAREAMRDAVGEVKEGNSVRTDYTPVA